MKIIGHRGAAELALENTIESLQAAKLAGVDGIEFDVRLTSDGHFVLSHDGDLSRTSSSELVIKDSTLEQLKAVPLNNGQSLPTLEEALTELGSTPAVIEAKGSNWAQPLADFLDKWPPIDAKVIAFNHAELAKFSQLSPAVPTYAIEQTKPIEAIQIARQNNFSGVDLNFWLLNPFTYLLARSKRLEIIVYTVNHRYIALFLNLFFPGIAITTDAPHTMQFLRPRKRRSRQPVESKSHS